jgi:DNA-binding MarR family transcriptional regulator
MQLEDSKKRPLGPIVLSKGGETDRIDIGALAMDEKDFEVLHLSNQICFPIYAASRLVMQAYRPLLAALGLTYPQYLVMMVLWETDTRTVRELGERLYLDSGTLTPLLKRLEKQGLLTRNRRKEDDRTVENHLTEAGRELQKLAVDIPAELVCNAELDRGELGELQSKLNALLAKLLQYHGIKESTSNEPKEE